MLRSSDSGVVLHNDSLFPTLESNLSIDANLTETDSCIAIFPIYVQTYRFITNGLLLNLTGLFGILGNIISIIILSRPQMRSSINYLLIGLARVDTVLIITSILLFGLPGMYPYSEYFFTYYYSVYPHIVPVVYPLATIAQTASVYLTLTVSLERFVAVCHPLRVKSLCTYGRARIYVIGIVIFSTLYNLPRLWESSIMTEFYGPKNITISCPRPSPFRNNPLYLMIYVHWLYLVFLYLLPFVSLALLNIAIYRQVLKANRERQLLSRLQRREIGLATMLLFVVAVFFVCNILPLIINVIETFNIRIDVAIMICTSNLLVTINSSVNFIIYVIFGEKFKRLFLLLFCHNALFGTGRDSPEGATHDDSFISNGDRTSMRLHRQNTTISGNGITRMNGSKRSSRYRTSSPGPCVYYPGSRTSKEITAYVNPGTD